MRIKKLIVLLVTVAAGLLLYQWRQIEALRRELAEERSRASVAEASPAAPAEADPQIEQWRRDAEEVHKLRAEVARLRREAEERLKAAAKAARQERPAPPEQPIRQAQAETTAPEREKEPTQKEGASFISKMNDLKAMSLAVRMFAQNKAGAMPGQISEAVSFLPAEYNGGGNWETYEITYAGRFDEIEAPNRTIVLKEKVPSQLANGKWAKAYGFADGHSEVHFEADPETFENWEKQRGIAGKAP